MRRTSKRVFLRKKSTFSRVFNHFSHFFQQNTTQSRNETAVACVVFAARSSLRSYRAPLQTPLRSVVPLTRDRLPGTASIGSDTREAIPKEGRLRRRLRPRPLGAAPSRLAVCGAIRRKAKSVLTDLLFRLHSSERRPRPKGMALPSLCICASQSGKSVAKRAAVLRLILYRNTAAWMVPPVCGRSAAAARKTPPCHLSRRCHTPTNKIKGRDERPQAAALDFFVDGVKPPVQPRGGVSAIHSVTAARENAVQRRFWRFSPTAREDGTADGVGRPRSVLRAV